MPSSSTVEHAGVLAGAAEGDGEVAVPSTSTSSSLAFRQLGKHHARTPRWRRGTRLASWRAARDRVARVRAADRCRWCGRCVRLRRMGHRQPSKSPRTMRTNARVKVASPAISCSPHVFGDGQRFVSGRQRRVELMRPQQRLGEGGVQPGAIRRRRHQPQRRRGRPRSPAGTR